MGDFLLILPECCLALTLVFIVLGEITYFGEESRLQAWVALTGLGCALVQVLMSYGRAHAFAFNDAVSVDGLSLYFKFLFIIMTGFSVAAPGLFSGISSRRATEIPIKRHAEYYALMVAACLAMCFAAGASELLLTFVALQAVNIIGYLLAGFGKQSIRSTEAGVKFLLLSGAAGFCFLYASGILFSAAHSLNIYEIHRALVLAPLTREQTLIVFMLFVVSIGFQIAAFPMCLWAPDVIEGAPTPVSGFLSACVPATGFVVTIRYFLSIFALQSGIPGQWKALADLQWTEILSLVAGATMVFGALLSLSQSSAKRMVGCLVVAQTGFFLLGLLVLDELGISAILYSLMIQMFSLVGIFYVLSFLHSESGSDRFMDFRGALSRSVPECISLILFLLCLVGVPPMPGFIGKFALIGVAIRHGQFVLAATAILTIGLSTITVSRLAFSLMGEAVQRPEVLQGGAQWLRSERKWVLASILIPIIITGVFAQFFLSWAGRSLGFIFW